MNSKNCLHRVRDLGLATVLVASLSAHADATLPKSNATSNQGLRGVSATMQQEADVSVVDVRISRGLANGIIVPRRLHIAIVGADGALRAEQVQYVGPAQLPRRSVRDAYLRTRLKALAGPDDRLAVQWLSAAEL